MDPFSNFHGLSSTVVNFDFNFWFMDAAITCMILLSGMYGERLIRSRTCDSRVLRIPDIFFEISPPAQNHAKKEGFHGNLKESEVEEGKSQRAKIYFIFSVFTICYFVMMAASTVLVSRHPVVMMIVQYFAVLLFINYTSTYFFQNKKGKIIGFLISLMWLCSAKTYCRWIINDIIVLFCALMTSHIQFRNFTYLQIFVWTAFVYDAFLLVELSIPFTTSLFSAENGCSRLCAFLKYNDELDLPTMFSVRFGKEDAHVFIGTGDIVIGALVSNFSSTFFKSRLHLIIIAASYALSIGLLYQVREKPFPALCSIVPICSLALLISSLCCNRFKEMIFGHTRQYLPNSSDVNV